MNMNFPRITFGIIVVNGEPFTRYCLRSLYPFAHEIIVVEGGHTGAAPVCTPDGHSTDGTLETLYRFKAEEDPENKVQIVTRDGFWPQKDEFGADRTPQSRAYAERATGDYLWQVDIDEFYQPEDIEKVRQILRENPGITAVEFKMLSFWGGLPYSVDTTADFRTPDRYPRHFHWGGVCRRLFKWGAEYRYVTHEPPTVYDDQGRNLRDMHLMTADQLVRLGVVMYHYSLMFPSQVRMKTRLYQNEKPVFYRELAAWAEDCFFTLKHPFTVHNWRTHWSWLERYHGSHPPAVYQMMADIKTGRVDCELRRTDDIEALLDSFSYRFGRTLLQFYELIWLVPWVRFKVTPVGRQVYRVIYGIRHPRKLMDYVEKRLSIFYRQNKIK